MTFNVLLQTSHICISFRAFWTFYPFFEVMVINMSLKPSQITFITTCISSGTEQFQHTTDSQRNFIIHFIDSAAASCQKATIDSTKSKRACAFKCWLNFISKVGIKSVYLTNFSRFQRNIIMSAFAQAMQEAHFSPTNRELLVEGTVCATLSYVAQAFWSNNEPNP